MKQYGMKRKTVLAYAPVSSGRAESMAGSMKKAIANVLTFEGLSWLFELPKALHIYRRWKGRAVVSPFGLMFGNPPKINEIESNSVIYGGTEESRMLKTLAVSIIISSKALSLSTCTTSEVNKVQFAIGSQDFLAKGHAVQRSFKWPTFESKYSAPYTVKESKH